MAPRKSQRKVLRKKTKKTKSKPMKKFDINNLQDTEFFCFSVKCGCRVTGKNVKLVDKPMPNGCPRVKGNCRQCGGKVYRILAKDTKLK